MNEENLTNDYADLSDEIEQDELLDDGEVGENEVVQAPIIKVQVSGDKLSALLNVFIFEDGQTVSCEDMIAALNENGIVYGLQEERIRAYCNMQNYDAPLLAAEGLSSQRGNDAEIIHYFECNRELKPKERADGTIDFHDMDSVQNVDKDQVLSYKILPTEGTEGSDIYGVKISALPGKDRSFVLGENVYVSEDGLYVHAAIDGYVEIKNDRITVRNMFTVQGDVDASVGNLDVNGSLLIRGDVREGFRIKAKGDIAIRGMVEGAMIECNGSVSIGEGINGMNRGKIYCNGDIHSRFIENTTVICDGDVHSEALLNSNISAGGSIILKSQRSSIRGGSYYAGVTVYAGDIGTSKNLPTLIAIASPEAENAAISDREDDRTAAIRTKKKDLRQLEKDIQNAEKTLQQLFRAEDMPDKKVLIRTLLVKKNQMNDSARLIKDQITALENTDDKEKRELSDFKVIVLGTIYPGTKIFIVTYNYEVKQAHQYTKFYVQDGYIEPSVLTPADKL
ncbi:MAG: DUF342 domain-containing protein [Anaerofustis sp.]